MAQQPVGVARRRGAARRAAVGERGGGGEDLLGQCGDALLLGRLAGGSLDPNTIISTRFWLRAGGCFAF